MFAKGAPHQSPLCQHIPVIEDGMLRVLPLFCLLFLFFSCSTRENKYNNGTPSIPINLNACLYKKGESVPLSPDVAKLPIENEIAFIETEVEGLRATFGYAITQDKNCPTKLTLGSIQFRPFSEHDEKVLQEKIETKVNWDIKAHIFMYYKKHSPKPEPYEKVLTIPLKFNNTQKSTFLGNFEVVEPKE